MTHNETKLKKCAEEIRQYMRTHYGLELESILREHGAFEVEENLDTKRLDAAAMLIGDIDLYPKPVPGMLISSPLICVGENLRDCLDKLRLAVNEQPTTPKEVMPVPVPTHDILTSPESSKGEPVGALKPCPFCGKYNEKGLSVNLDEMKRAIASKLSHMLDIRGNRILWRYSNGNNNVEVHWPTEGLQVCHEAEKLLTLAESSTYEFYLANVCGWNSAKEGLSFAAHLICRATYEQRLEALCRVWWPERFQ